MVEEVAQAEILPENADGDEMPSGESGQNSVSDADIVESEDTVAQTGDELARANTRIIELEQAINDKDAELYSLRRSSNELEQRVADLSNSLAETVASYKGMVIQANPEVVGEMVSGETIEAIDESLSKAKILVSRIRQGLEAEIELARIPAGAPERTPPDLSTLSPREKIQFAIGGRSSNK